ncbi:helix-turn-helix domain-containing protein [Streptomyces lavendulae]|uniref:helix-turn-helix domain-containing protein n=1 Tax=Streptomyces lavendulae TaxID=1914 RepID=UPI0033ECE800
MSVEALNYVRTLRLGDKYPTRKYILTLLADRADESFSCFPAVPLLAAEAEISDRAVQRALAALREDGLISDRVRQRANGSQASSRYFVHGPWDDFGGTGVPFPTITVPKLKREQQWQQQPTDGEFREGTTAARVLAGDIPAAQGGVTPASPGRMTPASGEGVTPASPLEPSPLTTTSNQPRPSVRTAKAAANEPKTDGRRDESAAEEKPRQAPPRVAVAPTEGVLLLTAIGNELPAFRLTGKVLRYQGLMVDGLLASGWSQEQIRGVVAGRPLPEKLTKTVGAVISNRIGAAAASPAPSAAPLLPRQSQGWHDQDQAPDEETYTAPAFGEHITPSRFYECIGDDRGIPCGKPCDPVTGLCREHSGERPCPASGCPRWTSNAGICDPCVQTWEDAETALRGAPGVQVIFGERTEAERLVNLSQDAR